MSSLSPKVTSSLAIPPLVNDFYHPAYDEQSGFSYRSLQPTYHRPGHSHSPTNMQTAGVNVPSANSYAHMHMAQLPTHHGLGNYCSTAVSEYYPDHISRTGSTAGWYGPNTDPRLSKYSRLYILSYSVLSLLLFLLMFTTLLFFSSKFSLSIMPR